MKKTTIALALSALMSLSACATTSGSTEDSPSSGTNRPSTTAEATEAGGDAAADASADDTEAEAAAQTPSVLAFGKAFTYTDGLQVTVSKPTPMTSGEWAAPSNAKGQAFTVTIVNDTEAPFDPTLAYITLQSANTEAEQIFDSEAGYGDSPQTTLLPGRETTYKVAFATPDASDLVMEFTPSWDHDPAIYATSGS
ncbi:hypothetical protein [Janibacter anophelis]|uniref:hypothetical protein n=1 Tax=Janibacter anophelis TaxID=319054 RepID=UPI00082F26F9|nr:hypothetical protein [Janibacter anophelis]